MDDEKRPFEQTHHLHITEKKAEIAQREIATYQSLSAIIPGDKFFWSNEKVSSNFFLTKETSTYFIALISVAQRAFSLQYQHGHLSHAVIFNIYFTVTQILLNQLA